MDIDAGRRCSAADRQRPGKAYCCQGCVPTVVRRFERYCNLRLVGAAGGVKSAVCPLVV